MKAQTFFDKLQAVLASRGFFWALIGWFVFQATWIALSAQYPMAFDEDFHMGIIKIYSQQLAPFLTSTPAGSSVFGAVVTDPSYLFHYVMSFPYRLLMMVLHNEMATIIILRLLNIALSVWALVLFRRLLLRSTLGGAGVNTIVAIIVLIPIFPLMAGQVNYDNLLLVWVAALCLVTQAILLQIRRHKLSMITLIQCVIICCLGSLTKYAFLPIAAAAVVTIIGYCIYQNRQRARRQAALKQLKRSWSQESIYIKLATVVILVVALGLFAQRYVVNIVSYRTPIPGCDKVLDVESCQAYGPWARDYKLKQSRKAAPESQQVGSVAETVTKPFSYTGKWLYGMWYRLFFMINGNVAGEYRHQNFPPLPIIGATAVVVAVLGFAALFWRWRLLLHSPLAIFFTLMIVFYVGAVWWQNYKSFLSTDWAVAVNGRYLLVILIPLGALMMMALKDIIQHHRARNIFATLAIVGFMSGCGIVSFLTRSNDHWYWHEPIVQQVNHTAQSVIDPLVWDEPTGHGIYLP